MQQSIFSLLSLNVLFFMLGHVSECSFATNVATDFYLNIVMFSLQAALYYVLISSDIIG